MLTCLSPILPPYTCSSCTPDDPRSAQLFEIACDSSELPQCIKRVRFGCLNFFLHKHKTATVDFLHSLSAPTTLSLYNTGQGICGWKHILSAFVTSAPYLTITGLTLSFPGWHTFLEFHRIVLSLPNVTELHISGLSELSTPDDPVVPAPPAPRIRKMCVEVQGDGTILPFWEGLCLYRSMYLDHLEEFPLRNIAPVELWAVVQAANLASDDLKVLEIECYQDRKYRSLFSHLTYAHRSHRIAWGFARFSPNVSPLHLNPPTYLRLGVFLNNKELPFINWWIKCFKAVKNESTVMERLTIKLTGCPSPVTMEQVKLLTRAFKELSNLLLKLVRNVDLVFQVQNCDTHPGLCTNRLREAIIDACKALKEKAKLRVFDMMEGTYDVPVSPFPTSTRRIF